MIRFALLALTTCLAIPAQAEQWSPEMYDPGADRGGGPADLILPMPCGGAMAFQKVVVSLDATDPLADVRVRLGQTGSASGHADFLRYGYIRGGFDEPGGAASYYYMSRYELTLAQAKALQDPDACAFTPSRQDTVTQGDISWFDALDYTRRYTEWLNQHAPDALPRRDGAKGYLRLPTETEWAFAARGGEAVSPAEFAATQFPMSDDISVYARFDADRMGPVGIKLPNPLGFYDIYGNAEEIVLDPFQMNAVGHSHGQPGGMVTRGASYQAGETHMRSAWRREWSLYGRSGKAQSQPTFGMRMVISAPVESSDQRLTRIRNAFEARLGAGASAQANLTEDLSRIIRDELDPGRRAALEGLQLALQTARDQAATTEARQLETTLLASATFLTAIWDDNGRLKGLEETLTRYDEISVGASEARKQEIIALTGRIHAGIDNLVVQSRHLVDRIQDGSIWL